MTSFTPDTLDSPDRVDALVWALTDLLITAPGTWRAV
jgi:phage terminase large subunit-like protein